MAWTHPYDIIAKLAALSLVASVVITCQGSMPAPMCIVLFAAAFMLWWLLLRPLSSLAYARFSLGADLTFREARRSSILFSPLINLTKWHPMREIINLHPQDRPPAIVKASDELFAYHDARSRKWRSAPVWARSLRVLLWLLVAVSIIGATTDVRPFIYLSRFQAYLFGGTYNPTINVVLAVLPLGILLALLEIKHGIPSVDPQAQHHLDETRGE